MNVVNTRRILILELLTQHIKPGKLYSNIYITSHGYVNVLQGTNWWDPRCKYLISGENIHYVVWGLHLSWSGHKWCWRYQPSATYAPHTTVGALKLYICCIVKLYIMLLVKLIMDIFTNRQHCVKFKGCMSLFKDITVGVPQGRVLGPRLWNLFISDFIHLSTM